MFKNILIAYDGSSYSEKALEAAMNFMEKDSEAQLHVLNVMDAAPLTGHGFYGPGLTSTVLGEFDETADKLLDEARELVVDYEEKCVFYKVKGNPAEELVDYANDNEIDLIIMGSRGLGAVRGLLLGSVSSRVLQQADCHVLVVK